MIFKIISENTPRLGLSIVPWLVENGFSWTANGLDSEEAGRALDGTMYRGLKGYKAKCEITCGWMTQEDSEALLSAIMPEFVTVVTDTLPWTNETVTMEMYSNNMKATCLTEYSDGERLYGDVEFPLVER